MKFKRDRNSAAMIKGLEIGRTTDTKALRVKLQRSPLHKISLWKLNTIFLVFKNRCIRSLIRKKELFVAFFHRLQKLCFSHGSYEGVDA